MSPRAERSSKTCRLVGLATMLLVTMGSADTLLADCQRCRTGMRCWPTREGVDCIMRDVCGPGGGATECIEDVCADYWCVPCLELGDRCMIASISAGKPAFGKTEGRDWRSLFPPTDPWRLDGRLCRAGD